jgi:hypothetical protein
MFIILVLLLAFISYGTTEVAEVGHLGREAIVRVPIMLKRPDGTNDVLELLFFDHDPVVYMKDLDNYCSRYELGDYNCKQLEFVVRKEMGGDLGEILASDEVRVPFFISSSPPCCQPLFPRISSHLYLL